MDNQKEALQSLVEELGINNFPEDKQKDILIKMTEALLKRIFVETIDRLDEEGKREYEKLIEEGAGEEKIGELIQSKITNYDKVVEKVIADFKSEMKKNL